MVYTFKNHNSEKKMLTFLYAVKERTKDNHIKWLCKCHCGNESVYVATRVRNKTSFQCKKCSSLDNAQKHKTHGMRKTTTYSSWQAMKERCLNQDSKSFIDYGGKGITICKQWINSFETFYLDMGERPNKTSINRINNKLGYFKENCEWSSHSEQQKNKNNSYFVEINGIIYNSPTDAAKAFNVTKQTIHKWVNGFFDKRRNKTWEIRDGCRKIFKY
jgi:hypothetical protein